MPIIEETGSLQVNSENILPIIKKWLYSDTDIFLRELVSNGCDAIAKLKRLAGIGEAELPEDCAYAVHVRIDKAAGTLTISDNGVGMDFDEVKLYINQIAKSSAADFLEKYKGTEKTSDIIGHFGLGFYSAFMAADKVEIETLSYKQGASPVKWESTGGVTYEMAQGARQERGTDIILHINDESKEFLEDYRVRAVLRKYMRFVPVEIYFDNDAPKPHEHHHDHDHEHDEHEHDHDHEHDDAPKPVNDVNPLWTRNPSDITDDEYKAFYHQLFTDFNEPLFWIHLNMDYPNRLKGILYFPKFGHEFETVEGQVKLFCNQVFIADNIKEVIPEFLLLLKGVVDCPDLPLNVSRSALQADDYSKKLSSYIVKKVADKLNGLCNTDRAEYERFWDDISPFIKYGCIKEDGFYDKIKQSVLYKTSGGKYLSLEQYLSANEPKIGKKMYYATDEKQQSRYISVFTEQGTDVAVLTGRIDAPFVSYAESREMPAYDGGDGENAETPERFKFVRIDAAMSENIKKAEEVTDYEKADDERIVDIFKRSLGGKADSVDIEVQTLTTADIPAVILLTEDALRMQEMQKMFGAYGGGMFGAGIGNDKRTLAVNRANAIVRRLLETDGEVTELICNHIFDMAQMSDRPLTNEEMNDYILRSNKILMLLAEK